MLELINRYLHGFVSIPVILACKNRGLFHLLKHNHPLTMEEIISELNANSGHFHVAMRLLESLGWIERNESNQCSLLPDAEIADEIPSDVLNLFHLSIENYLQRGTNSETIR